MAVGLRLLRRQQPQAATQDAAPMKTRRQFLCTAAATAAAAVLPAVPSVAAAQTPLDPAWFVGTDCEFNWQFVRAPTKEAAKLEWLGLADLPECETPCPDGPGYCGCAAARDLSTQRVPELDAIEDPTKAQIFMAGMGQICDRCSYETFPEENGRVVLDEVVCEDCMTLADWEIVDPERAAEMREDALA